MASKSSIGNIDELLQEYVIHMDEVHREAEEWDEQVNLLAVLDHFKIGKELSNIAETLILFIEERTCYFQLEDFSRISIQSRKSLGRSLDMTKTALQATIKELKSNNLLPNMLFGFRMSRRLTIAMTELVSMEIQTMNPYIDLERFSSLKDDQQTLLHSYFNTLIQLKFNTCLSVYKLTLFLDMALNRSKDELTIVPKRGSMDESLSDSPSPLRNEDLAINYHLMIFMRQIENGLTLNLKTHNPILQFELQSRLRKLKQILMEIYADHKNIDGLMKETKMKI